MKVELISYSPNPDSVVAASARLCYSAVGIDEINQRMSEEEKSKLVKNLVSVGHFSPVEHVSFTFAIEGISRTCSHQIVRHRLASYSQQSQRYVKAEQFEYIIPPQIEENEEAKKIFIEQMESSHKAYEKITKLLEEKNYENLIGEGKSEKRAKNAGEKISIEDARYVFPNAAATKMVVTMNARSLHNFFRLRMCERAQWEIREVAYAMLEEAKKVAPVIFKNAGPSCVGGECSEGDMSCGKPEIPRARVAAMKEGK